MDLVLFITYYYIDTDEIPGFFVLLKNDIFIAPREDTILSFTCEDIGVAMVTNFLEQKIYVLLSLFLLYNFICEFHNIFF